MLELSDKKAGDDVKFSLLLVRMKEAKHPALDLLLEWNVCCSEWSVLPRRPQSGGGTCTGLWPRLPAQVPQGVAHLSLWHWSSGSSERTSDFHQALWLGKFPKDLQQ